ncbi:MAG: segregation/condensation protein A [Gammaproteobacteria bacterium]|jgi:segregation and condensation protein A|nr:segregation/condensation protein A [Gammaproteobacteria bacterium]MBT5644213.1 segregation/condensation protein A [Gammaproteobacteria bacterium]MBT7236104.1 segregation/condensation protein A [Gammaproteobacteria bacterium]|tara:strand:- start:145 stop:939 length:795 start_codon:yes stop_codon:yes gene_type:complete
MNISNVNNNDVSIIFNGKKITDIPEDLFIPPEALRVIIEQFEGPLDLLLYLIKKQNIDVVDIPILPITNQYVEYINMMQQMQFELASDYLVMASTLAEIKSRMLVPNEVEDDEEEDPRANLIKRLMEYQKYKDLSEQLDEIPRLNRDTFIVSKIFTNIEKKEYLPSIDLQELENAFQEVLKRAEIFASHEIQTETLSVRERMSLILDIINKNGTIKFIDCFTYEEGRMGVIVTFLAILELSKESLIDIVQNQDYSMIYLQSLKS